jgi:CheY-like chemotaxis protein
MTSTLLHELIIADDDAGIRDMLARAFSKDFRVATASDGSEAIALLERGRPAAVLVDEMMPGATGTQVLEHAKALFPDVPRLLMTASNDTARAMGAGIGASTRAFAGGPPLTSRAAPSGEIPRTLVRSPLPRQIRSSRPSHPEPTPRRADPARTARCVRNPTPPGVAPVPSRSEAALPAARGARGSRARPSASR